MEKKNNLRATFEWFSVPQEVCDFINATNCKVITITEWNNKIVVFFFTDPNS